MTTWNYSLANLTNRANPHHDNGCLFAEEHNTLNGKCYTLQWRCPFKQGDPSMQLQFVNLSLISLISLTPDTVLSRCKGHNGPELELLAQRHQHCGVVLSCDYGGKDRGGGHPGLSYHAVRHRRLRGDGSRVVRQRLGETHTCGSQQMHQIIAMRN